MSEMMKPRVYIVRHAVFAPSVLSAAAAVVAVQWSWWFLVAIPFVWLGSICAQPNLNLADGCLAYLAIIVGLGVLPLFKLVGVAILAGTISGFYLSAVEKWARLRTAPEPPAPHG